MRVCVGVYMVISTCLNLFAAAEVDAELIQFPFVRLPVKVS